MSNLIQPREMQRVEKAIHPIEGKPLMPGESEIIYTQALAVFKPKLFVVDPVVAPYFVIRDIKEGYRLLFVSEGGMAATLFPPIPEERKNLLSILGLENTTWTPGMIIQIMVHRYDNCFLHTECIHNKKFRDECRKEAIAIPFLAAFHGVTMSY